LHLLSGLREFKFLKRAICYIWCLLGLISNNCARKSDSGVSYYLYKDEVRKYLEEINSEKQVCLTEIIPLITDINKNSKLNIAFSNQVSL
jgi:DNA gyrase/topoisomerase IV subunit B